MSDLYMNMRKDYKSKIQKYIQKDIVSESKIQKYIQKDIVSAAGGCRVKSIQFSL